MGLRDRWLLRRLNDGNGTLLDREARPDDLESLRAFAREHAGVELYVEPETAASDTTALAVDAAGASIRRRVGSPAVARRLGRSLGVPVYDAQIVGYPERMRAFNRQRAAGNR